jgi:NAD(P)-dependent dehydrogenase (short-subunit alcohol dehydrogenase family)
MKIVITGASSGIGKHLADELEGVGHEICRIARTPMPGFCLRADVTEWYNLQSAAFNVGQTWGSADALICCAGFQDPIGPTMQIDPVAWKKNLAVNLDGTFFSIRAFYPVLQKSPSRAKILCFSGGGSTSPRPNFAAYAVAKTGIVRLVETLAAEWEGERFDINAIAPGAIFTHMTEQVLARGEKLVGKKEFAAASSMPRDNSEKLKKVLGLVSFLLSEKGDGISGRLIAAQWDPWEKLAELKSGLGEDIYTLRRIVPRDRGKDWGGK